MPPLRRIREALPRVHADYNAEARRTSCSAPPSAPVSASPLACRPRPSSLSAQMQPTPNRRAGEGEGPFDRLVIRGVTVIDGTGAPPRGPMDIVVAAEPHHRDRQRRLPEGADQRARRPAKGTKEIDGTGMYVMPGFVDAARALRRRPGQRSRIRLQAVDGARRDHGARRAVRLDGLGPERSASCRRRTRSSRRASSPITGRSPARAGIARRPQTPETAREWVRFAAKKGVDGLKLGALRSRDHGGAARRGEEAQPRLDRAPRSDGRRAHERPRRVAPRPRHA